MKIGIIGAMKEEITPLLALFPRATTHQVGGNTFYEINYKNAQIFIAYSKIGKVHSAITTTTMILYFHCEKIIFSGVAGGLGENLKIGDLLLATQLCQHDVDITAFGHPVGFIPESTIYTQTDATLNHIAKTIAQKKGIPLKEGVIASGDTFVHNAEKKQWLIQNFNAKAVEMEGASLGVVCSLFKVPFCVFRSISDNADGEANISFDEFLERAAEVSGNFVKEMIDEIIQTEQNQ